MCVFLFLSHLSPSEQQCNGIVCTQVERLRIIIRSYPCMGCFRSAAMECGEMELVAWVITLEDGAIVFSSCVEPSRGERTGNSSDKVGAPAQCPADVMVSIMKTPLTNSLTCFSLPAVAGVLAYRGSLVIPSALME